MNDTETTAEIVSLIDMQRDHVALGNRKRELPVQLTEAEWKERAEATADRWRDLVTLKAAENVRRKVFTSGHKEREAEHARLAGIVAAKAEPRMVRVRDYGMAGPNEVVTIRVDTSEVVSRRAMSFSERELVMQVPLAFPTVCDEDSRRDVDGSIGAGSDLNAMEHGEDPDGVEPHPLLGSRDFPSYLTMLQHMEPDRLIMAEQAWENINPSTLYREEALISIGELLALHDDHGVLDVAESHADDLPPEPQ